jgi:two-component system LytT family sensor kinase
VTDSTEHSDGTRPLSRAEWLGVFAFWTLMAVLTAANRVADQRDVTFSAVPHGIPIALAFQQMYLWALLTPLVFWLAGRFNAEQSSAWVRVAALIAIGVVIAYSVDLINSTLVRAFKAHPQPGSLAGAGGRGPPGGAFSILRGPMILNHFILFWGVLAAGFARDYFLRFRAHEREAARTGAHRPGEADRLPDGDRAVRRVVRW